MHVDEQHEPGMKKLSDMIGQVQIAMLTTEEPDGTLRSRPLATLQLDAEGKLWFFTGLSSGKVAEMDRHRKVNLSYADVSKQSYVSISGRSRMLRDREKMQELWTPWIKPWFPDGLDDPDLGLLEVTVEEAEYWDAPASRMQRLLGLTQALAGGGTENLGEHGKVKPHSAPGPAN